MYAYKVSWKVAPNEKSQVYNKQNILHNYFFESIHPDHNYFITKYIEIKNFQ